MNIATFFYTLTNSTRQFFTTVSLAITITYYALNQTPFLSYKFNFFVSLLYFDAISNLHSFNVVINDKYYEYLQQSTKVLLNSQLSRKQEPTLLPT